MIFLLIFQEEQAGSGAWPIILALAILLFIGIILNLAFGKDD